MNTFVDVLAAVLMLAGSSLALIAAVGLFRMPDAYSRIHVATKPATLAVVCTVGAAVLRVPELTPTTKLLLAVALQFWTAPVASHMLGRAAHAAGLRPDEPWVVDDLEAADDDSGGNVDWSGADPEESDLDQA
ncbi:MAG: monovalent cation/H(+) antiporter subunit G, partial [Microthrixaceae bacterium]